MTTFNPLQHKLTFLNINEAQITSPDTWLANSSAIWAVDAFLSAMNASGLLNIIISDTQPGNTETVWVDPYNPASAAASTTKLWNSANGLWEQATLGLFVDLIKRVGGFVTSTSSGNVVGFIQNSLTGDGSEGTPLGVRIDNTGAAISVSVSASGIKVAMSRDMPKIAAPTTNTGVMVSETAGGVAGTKAMSSASYVEPTRFAALMVNLLYPGTVSIATAAPGDTTKPWFNSTDGANNWSFYDDKNAVWVQKTLVDASTMWAYAAKKSGTLPLITSTSTPSAGERVNIWLDLNTMGLKYWDGTAWVANTPAGVAGINLPDATETVKGKIELATVAEVAAGADTVRAVTPAGLAALVSSDTVRGLIELATVAEATAGADNSRAVTPAGLAAAVVASIASKVQVIRVNHPTGTVFGVTGTKGFYVISGENQPGYIDVTCSCANHVQSTIQGATGTRTLKVGSWDGSAGNVSVLGSGEFGTSDYIGFIFSV